jgi:hypothetical protein|nr:MAG TPA: hypothetical protein [Caudoviricetes sp.]
MRTNKKKAFLMYLDSLEPVYMMDDKQKAGLLNAIVAYQFEDNEMLEEAKKDQVVNIVFSRIEKYFKENEGAYEQTCLQNQANGRKGGNPNFKKGQSNPYYKKDNRGITEDNRPVMSGNEKITEDNRGITEDNRRLPDNDNDNDNDNEELSTNADNSEKENLSLREKDERKQLSFNLASEEFLNFQKWLKENCPFVLRVRSQMNEKEYNKLMKRYSKKELCDALESLNNWKDFPKKRTSVYRSTLDELKLKFGERI